MHTPRLRLNQVRAWWHSRLRQVLQRSPSAAIRAISVFLLSAGLLAQAQQLNRWPSNAVVDDLPDAPQPGITGSQAGRRTEIAFASFDPALAASPQAAAQETRPGDPSISEPRGSQPTRSKRQHPEVPSVSSPCFSDMTPAAPVEMTCAPGFSPYRRFIDATGPHPLTSRQKGIQAFRNTVDPFNFLTIAAESGLAVASDSHSAYGPGFAGYGRNFGVAYTEVAVGDFFGTFLIPSLAHQDPRYYRMPHASIQRRITHAVTEVVWGQSDTGQGMLNFANLGTTAIGDALGNLYIPGRQQGWGPGISRFATAIATDPIDNIVTEFLPDVARRVNVRIVLVQRIVNEVERQNGVGQ